ncbi:hypothetical protein D3C71_1465140 [compost metagenome]
MLAVQNGAFDLRVGVLHRRQLAHGFEVAAAGGRQQPVAAQAVSQIGVAVAADELLQVGGRPAGGGRGPELIAQEPVFGVHAQRVALGLRDERAQDGPLLAVHGLARGDHGSQRWRIRGGRQACQHGGRHGNDRLRRLYGGLGLRIDGGAALLRIHRRTGGGEQRHQGQPSTQAGADIGRGGGGAYGLPRGFLIPSGLQGLCHAAFLMHPSCRTPAC